MALFFWFPWSTAAVRAGPLISLNKRQCKNAQVVVFSALSYRMAYRNSSGLMSL